MVAKKRLLGLAVVLGFILGGAIALVRVPKREAIAIVEPAPTNVVVQVAKTNVVALTETNVVVKVVQTNAVAATVATNVAVRPKPPRKPIVNDPKIPKARQVLLANRRIAVEKGRSFPKKFCATQTPTSRGTAPYVVISELPVSRDVRIQAVADGAKVVGFLPNNALLVEADAQALKNLEDDLLFTAAVEYEPTDKIQRALLDEKGETVEATVVLLNPKDREPIQKFVTDNDGTMLRGAPSEKSVSATIPRTLVTELAGKAEVKWIERYARMKLHNDIAVKPGLMNVTPVREVPLGLTGAGQIITTSDTGIDTGDRTTMHADLTNTVIGMEAVDPCCHMNDVNGHGTHTAGSIVGDGTMSRGQVRGTAYGAKLWAWCMVDDKGEMWVPGFGEDLFRPYGIAAHIHSASWGWDDDDVEQLGGAYISYCGEVDEFVWKNADFLPVFAAGNAGEKRTTISVLPMATAKNVLAVGASENLRPSKDSCADNPAQIAYFSSCGPCEDGRIKPDIVAPGTYVLSCLSSKASRCKWDDGSYEHYQYMSGTSMATPLTAGTAALVREWLARYQAKANPSAALVKAIMLGGATDLFYESGNNVLKSVPDTRQGWGRVDLAGTVAPTNGLATFLADRLPFGAGSNFTFRVTTTNAAPLNVQLAWVDYPGEAAAAKVLVNDLDLRVTAGGQEWLGNGATEADELNNAESVRVREAAATTYLVRVKCSAIPYGCDEGGAAAIYIRGAFDPAKVKCGEPVGVIWMIR